MSDPILALVPREPTDAMLAAAQPAMKEVNDRLAMVQLRNGRAIKWPNGEPPLKHAWRAMIAAYEADTSAALKTAPRSRAGAQRDIAVAALDRIALGMPAGQAAVAARIALANIDEIEKTAR